MAEEADGVKNAEEIDTSTTESPTEEINDDGVISLDEENLSEEEPEEVKDKGTTEGDKADEETETSTPETKTEDTSPKNAETRKQQLNNEIRDKVAERNALKREIAELNRQKYQLKNSTDLPTVEALTEQVNPDTGDYYTLTEAKLARIEAERELEREQRQLDEYTDNVVDNRLRLRDEADRALKDFPMFDENSSDYNESLAKQADRIAESLLLKDGSGEIIGSNGSIYDVYAAIANAAQSAETNGKIAGRKAAVEMMSSADVVGASNTSSTTEDSDPFLKGFKKAFD